MAKADKVENKDQKIEKSSKKIWISGRGRGNYGG